MTTWAQAAQTVSARWAKRGRALAVPPDDPNEDDREFWREVQALVDGAPVRESVGRLREYSDDEPRDDHGQWMSGGDSGAADAQAFQENLQRLDPGPHSPDEQPWQRAQTGFVPSSSASPEDRAAAAAASQWAEAPGRFPGPTRDQLDSSQVFALRQWRDGADVNVGLRQDPPNMELMVGDMEGPSHGALDYVGGNVQAIDSVMANSTTGQDLTVFRGGDTTPLSQLNPGQTFSDPGYVATSLRESVGGWFAEHDWASFQGGPGSGTLFEIHVPAGSNAISMDKLGISGNVNEVLLPRNSVFDVASVQPDRVVMNYRGVAG